MIVSSSEKPATSHPAPAATVRSSQQAAAKLRIVTERGKKPFIGARRKWLGRCESVRGRNSVLMRGTPKKRLSLAETRARKSIAKVQAAKGFAAPHAAWISASVVIARASSCQAMVPTARAKRGQPCTPGGQGRAFGPVSSPERNASSIQPQTTSAETKPRYTPAADPRSNDSRAPRSPSASTGSPQMTEARCAPAPRLSAARTRHRIAPVENHQRKTAASAAIQGLSAAMRGASGSGCCDQYEGSSLTLAGGVFLRAGMV